MTRPQSVARTDRNARGRRVLDVALAGACLLILAVGLPADFQAHAHWNKVAWMPFVSSPVRIVDCALNALLFLPLGFLSGLRNSGRTLSWLAFALALSVLCEVAQVFSHGRFPSMTDVGFNIVGMIAGSLAGILVASRRRSWLRLPAQP